MNSTWQRRFCCGACPAQKMMRLEDVGEGNWRIPLAVSDEQKEYVVNSATILARAYAYRNARSRAYIIYNDETPVGMGLYYDAPDSDAYIFSELFIDARYQGRGYGKEATRMVLDAMKDDGKYGKVVLCYIEGNEAAQRLYEGFGFIETDRDGNEIVMELLL